MLYFNITPRYVDSSVVRVLRIVVTLLHINISSSWIILSYGGANRVRGRTSYSGDTHAYGCDMNRSGRSCVALTHIHVQSSSALQGLNLSPDKCMARAQAWTLASSFSQG